MNYMKKKYDLLLKKLKEDKKMWMSRLTTTCDVHLVMDKEFKAYTEELISNIIRVNNQIYTLEKLTEK